MREPTTRQVYMLNEGVGIPQGYPICVVEGYEP